MVVYKPISAKIIVGSHGLGTPDMDLVEKRAREVAEIQEHPFPNAGDWAEARRELHGFSDGQDSALEVESGSSGAAGVSFEELQESFPELRAVLWRVSREEDPTVGEELVNEGMEEAEHERMLLAHQRAPQ